MDSNLFSKSSTRCSIVLFVFSRIEFASTETEHCFIATAHTIIDTVIEIIKPQFVFGCNSFFNFSISSF